jgi:histidinol-phosphate aminotransferase
MTKIENLVRQNILKLKPYSSARSEYTGRASVFLDANENPFGKLNRYPDPCQSEVKKKLADFKKVGVENIFIGNGSDEVIDLAFRIFCNPGVDKALVFSPTYGMYKVSAVINNTEIIELPLNDFFQINLKEVIPYLSDSNIKLVFICSPNNPTGNLIDIKDIEFVLNAFEGIVIIDEAYIDFAEAESLIPLIEKYNNLIVAQTFSKAWGLAAIRVGVAYASPEIIAFYNKVKPPYNISKLNQEAVVLAISNQETYQENLSTILFEKKRLEVLLNQIDLIKKVHPSMANFFLIEVDDADKVYKSLMANSIIVRNRSKQITNCIRITIGTAKENDQLIKALKDIQ